MRERLFVLLLGIIAIEAQGSTLNPLVLPGCPTQGVYQEVEASGPTQTIWYVPYRLGIDAAADSLSVFSWAEANEDWLSLSLNLRLLPVSDAVQACVRAAFPQHTLKEIAPSRVTLQFLSSSAVYAAEVDGGENLDIFDKAQWIGLNLHGKNLRINLKNAGDSFSFRAFFRGAVLWDLPYEIGGVHTLRQALTFSASDEARLNLFVKEALHDL